MLSWQNCIFSLSCLISSFGRCSLFDRSLFFIYLFFFRVLERLEAEAEPLITWLQYLKPSSVLLLGYPSETHDNPTTMFLLWRPGSLSPHILRHIFSLDTVSAASNQHLIISAFSSLYPHSELITAQKFLPPLPAALIFLPNGTHFIP